MHQDPTRSPALPSLLVLGGSYPSSSNAPMPMCIIAHYKYTTFKVLIIFFFCVLTFYHCIESLSFIAERTSPKGHIIQCDSPGHLNHKLRNAMASSRCYFSVVQREYHGLFKITQLFLVNFPKPRPLKSMPSPELQSFPSMACWLPRLLPLTGQIPRTIQSSTYKNLSNSSSFVVYQNGKKWRHWQKSYVSQNITNSKVYGLIIFV